MQGVNGDVKTSAEEGKRHSSCLNRFPGGIFLFLNF